MYLCCVKSGKYLVTDLRLYLRPHERSDLLLRKVTPVPSEAELDRDRPIIERCERQTLKSDEEKLTGDSGHRDSDHEVCRASEVELAVDDEKRSVSEVVVLRIDLPKDVLRLKSNCYVLREKVNRPVSSTYGVVQNEYISRAVEDTHDARDLLEAELLVRLLPAVGDFSDEVHLSDAFLILRVRRGTVGSLSVPATVI